MSTFDTLFFGKYVPPGEEIKHIFHRHIYFILEDIVLWIFFGLLLPGFLYYYDSFGMQGISPWAVVVYIATLYILVMYKVFDWYNDAWIITNTGVIDVKWKIFHEELQFFEYDKISGMEVRTRSWWMHSIGAHDIEIRLMGDEHSLIVGAPHAQEIINHIKECAASSKHHDEHIDDREPFDMFVHTMSEVIRNNAWNTKSAPIDPEYIQILDTQSHRKGTIDLRSAPEKEKIHTWKEKNMKEDVHTDH